MRGFELKDADGYVLFFGKFFTEPHYAGFPAILVRLPAVTVRELEAIITEGWRCQAPRDLTLKQTPPRACANHSQSQKKSRAFATRRRSRRGCRSNHARETELWLKIHKKDSGLATVTNAQAVDVALCWGWIDGLRKRFDEPRFCSGTRRAGEEHVEPGQP